MDLMRQIDNYCERMSSAFWAEPVNAITNLAFIIGALAALSLATRLRRLDGPVVYLIAVAMAVGIGSFLFHTYATVWSAIADTGPIGVFILSYFIIAMNRYVGIGWGKAALLTVGFLIAMGALSWLFREIFQDSLGGSQSYFPALLALLLVGMWIAWLGHPAGRALIVAAGVFAVSLVFRTADIPVCQSFPLGTHFMWHILNGLLLFLLIRALILHGEPAREPARAAA